MKVEFPSLDDVCQLPEVLNQSIPVEWQDYNGHVNVMYYMKLYEIGGWTMMEELGLDESYFSERRCGLFDLEHHIAYTSELHVGEEVSMYYRLLGYTPKRFHGLTFIVNRTRMELASTLEFITTGANLDTRRTAVLPDDIAAAIAAKTNEQAKLDWAPPVCGVMSA